MKLKWVRYGLHLYQGFLLGNDDMAVAAIVYTDYQWSLVMPRVFGDKSMCTSISRDLCREKAETLLDLAEVRRRYWPDLDS